MADPGVYTIGWISALDLEYAAAQEFLEVEHQAPRWVHPSDDNHYTLGKIGRHNVVMAVLPSGETGVAAAAMAAKDMRHTFPQVRVCLLVGIGGGAPSDKNDIRLGDVVVSIPSFHPRSGNHGGVFQYDFARTIREGRFQSQRFLSQPPRALLAAANGLRARHRRRGNTIDSTVKEILDRRPRMRREYGRPDPATDLLYKTPLAGDTTNQVNLLVDRPARTEEDDDPAIHYGLVASAENFMENAEVRDLLAGQLNVLCFEMEAAGLMNNLPCLVVRGICDYADSHWVKEWRGFAAMTAAAYARHLLYEVVPDQLEVEKGIGQLLDQMRTHLEDIETVIQGARSEVKTLQDQVHDADVKAVLDRLPIASGASFDSEVEEGEPRCLPDTRVEILSQIDQWVADPDAESVFWLKGMAGTGKSTISRSVAHDLDKAGRLGASYFFKRGGGDCGILPKFVTTIASQLAAKRPMVAGHIKSAIDADPAIIHKGLEDQFEKLIRLPLLAARSTTEQDATITLVIDALDECELGKKAGLVIELLSRHKDLGLKIFITSRPELLILQGFHSIEGKYQNVDLHDMYGPATKQDITVFIQSRMETIRHQYKCWRQEEDHLPEDWPGLANIECLVDMANPLFIFASTVCLFLADDRGSDPDEKLQEVLEYRTKSQESRLNATYLPVLERLTVGLTRRDSDKVLTHFRLVVGSIVALASPLSARSLSRLLSVSQGTVDGQLRMLHSVLNVPQSARSPVRLLHISFRDFLFDPEKKGESEFWIDEAQTHAELAGRCLQTMTEVVRKDMCGLEQLGLQGSTVDMEQVDQAIPAEAQYACLHWVFHVEGAGDSMVDVDRIAEFMRSRYLQWIEVLCLMRRGAEAVSMMQRLQALIQGRAQGELSDLVADGLQLLRANVATVVAAPLQIYSSTLLFAPWQSAVRRSFESQMSRGIRRRRVDEGGDWVRVVQTFQTRHALGFQAMAFSPDLVLMALAADETVSLRRIDSGEGLRDMDLGPDMDSVLAMAFSGDSSVIGIAAPGGVQLRRVETGECVWQVEADGPRGYTAAAFSADFSLVATGTDGGVQRRRTESGEAVDGLALGGDGARLLAFSHDLELMAVGSSSRGRVELRRIATDECVVELGTTHNPVESAGLVAFSPDGSLVLSSWEEKVALWRAETGECLHVLTPPPSTEEDMATAAVFSHDSALVAVGADDGTVRLWCAETGECVRTNRPHREWVYRVALSPDSTLMASAAADQTVQVWRTSEAVGDATTANAGADRRQCAVAVAADSSLVAVAWGRVIELWRGDMSERLRTLEGHVLPVSLLDLSADLSRLVSLGSLEGIRLWRTDSGELVGHMRSNSTFVALAVLSPDASLVAGVGWSPGARAVVWRADSGQVVRELEGKWQSVAISPDSTLVAVLAGDATAQLWSIDGGTMVRQLDASALETCLLKTLDGFQLDTSLGIFALRLLTGYEKRFIEEIFAPTETDRVARHVGWGLGRCLKWITWDGRDFLYLPREYQPLHWAFNQKVVVLGCRGGRVVLLDLTDPAS